MTLISERIGQFFWDGHRLEFTEYGAGDRWVVLVHGQLMPRRMHQPLARRLAGAGAHVVTVDLLGHGRSDRPEDPLLYSMTAFGEQVVALLDELGAGQAVVGGTSLGANVSLEVATLAPDRVRGMILEMPVLDNAVEAGILAFAPLLFVSRFLPGAVSVVRWAAHAVPRGVVPFWAGVALDTMSQRPGAMAATIHGIFFGRVAPSSRQRREIQVPALVVGHDHDPIHPAADAAMLAEELPHAEFVQARSILEWRVHPQRLDDLAADFVDRCWDGPLARPPAPGLGDNGPVPLYSDEAVVLRTRKLAEADRIITLLTRRHGVVRAVAKGVRRTTSRFGSRLEPFTHVDLQLAEGRNLDVVTQAETRAPFGARICDDYDRYTAGSVMLETAERLVAEERQPSVQQYLLLVGALGALATAAHRPGDILDSFLLRSLAVAGYAPSFETCVRCGAPGPHTALNPSAGGVLCGSCRLPGSASPAPETIRLLGALLAGDWPAVDGAADRHRREARGLVSAYLSWHLERGLRSLPYATSAQAARGQAPVREPVRESQ